MNGDSEELGNKLNRELRQAGDCYSHALLYSVTRQSKSRLELYDAVTTYDFSSATPHQLAVVCTTITNLYLYSLDAISSRLNESRGRYLSILNQAEEKGLIKTNRNSDITTESQASVTQKCRNDLQSLLDTIDVSTDSIFLQKEDVKLAESQPVPSFADSSRRHITVPGKELREKMIFSYSKEWERMDSSLRTITKEIDFLDASSIQLQSLINARKAEVTSRWAHVIAIVSAAAAIIALIK